MRPSLCNSRGLHHALVGLERCNSSHMHSPMPPLRRPSAFDCGRLGRADAFRPPGFGTPQESTGVLAMIDLLVKDLDKEMQEADVVEKNAQAVRTDAGVSRCGWSAQDPVRRSSLLHTSASASERKCYRSQYAGRVPGGQACCAWSHWSNADTLASSKTIQLCRHLLLTQRVRSRRSRQGALLRPDVMVPGLRRHPRRSCTANASTCVGQEACQQGQDSGRSESTTLMTATAARATTITASRKHALNVSADRTSEHACEVSANCGRCVEHRRGLGESSGMHAAEFGPS